MSTLKPVEQTNKPEGTIIPFNDLMCSKRYKKPPSLHERYRFPIRHHIASEIGNRARLPAAWKPVI